jgi:hypothetical protein
MSKKIAAASKAVPSRKSTRSAASSAKEESAPVTVRHYCQGIGDCHLLKFPKGDGTPFFMLIDCGVHTAVKGGTGKIKEIVEDIANVTKGIIDVVVVTHEHVDHISGFLTAADQFAKFKVGEVWMAWTENPADAQARELDKFKQQALSAMQGVGLRLGASEGLTEHLQGVSQGLQALLGFNFGAKGERVRSMRDAAAGLAPKNLKYLEPNNAPMTVPGLGDLLIYVLGPPRDRALLGVTERASEMYGVGNSNNSPLAAALSSGLAINSGLASSFDDYAAPFDSNLGEKLSDILRGIHSGPTSPASRPYLDFVRTHYLDSPPAVATKAKAKKSARISGASADQAWRRIDSDWLGISADLAMQLDDRTNNTSLVLAFEFGRGGRVMLFAADAQVGNWLSWQDLSWGKADDVVTGPGLLARTIYYKVGHHGSENATLKAKGLELMTNSDLSAFVPTNQKDAENVHWGRMPHPGILADLLKRTATRTVRADDEWVQQGSSPGFAVPSGSLQSAGCQAGLWVEFAIR